MIRRVTARALLFALAVLAAACADHPESRGRQLYADHGCAVCHGASGTGDGPSASRLDTAPRDFADPRAYRQGSSRDEIAASIRNGGGAMPPFRDITEAEANDMAAWIVSLQRQPGPSGRVPPPSGAGIVVRDAWVRESTATRTSSAGYLTIENRNDASVALVGVSVAGVGEAQMHTTVEQQGQSAMRRAATVPIPAHGTLEFAPGGTHVMLTDIAHPLQVGSTVEMTLTFDNKETRTVDAAVRPMTAMSAR